MSGDEAVEERDLIAASEIESHDPGGGCRCGPKRTEVSLDDGARRGVVWIHRVTGPVPEDEVAKP